MNATISDWSVVYNIPQALSRGCLCVERRTGTAGAPTQCRSPLRWTAEGSFHAPGSRWNHQKRWPVWPANHHGRRCKVPSPGGLAVDVSFTRQGVDTPGTMARLTGHPAWQAPHSAALPQSEHPAGRVIHPPGRGWTHPQRWPVSQAAQYRRPMARCRDWAKD